MKFVLCSEGFYTPAIIEECVKLVGKPKDSISVGIINEAYAVEDHDKRWVIDNLNSAASNFGGDIDLVNLLALPIDKIESRLRDKDVIYVVGGHTDYLMSVFNKSGFDTLIPELLKTKVYVGSSAGSMVAGRRISAAAYKMIYYDEDIYGISAYMELVNFSVMPHLDSPQFPNRKHKLLEAVNKFEGKVYGLRDDSAVIVDGDNTYTIGSEPIIIDKAKLIS